MSQVEVQYSLQLATEQLESDVRKLEATLMRVLGYIRQFTGGNAELDFLIRKIQQTITAIRTLQVSLAALTAATGPIGAAYAGVSLVTTALAFQNIADLSEGY